MIQPSADLVENIILPFLENDQRPTFILDCMSGARLLYSNLALDHLEQRYEVNFARECYDRIRTPLTKPPGNPTQSGILVSGSIRYLAIAVEDTKFNVCLQAMPRNVNEMKDIWIGLVGQVIHGQITPSDAAGWEYENIDTKLADDAALVASTESGNHLRNDHENPLGIEEKIRESPNDTGSCSNMLDAVNETLERNPFPDLTLDWTRKWKAAPTGVDIDQYNLLLAVKWEETALGPVSSWSTSLRANVSSAMFLNHPVAIYWGDKAISIYNSAWQLVAQERHPKLMGLTFREGWPEPYDYFMPLIARTKRGEVVQEESTLFLLNREIQEEETYVSFTLSPMIDDNGHYQCTFTQAIISSDDVFYARRTSVLSALEEKTALICDLAEGSHYWTGVLEALDENPLDSPFALLYRVSGGNTCKLVGSRGVTSVFAEYNLYLDRDQRSSTAQPFIFLKAMRKARNMREMVHLIFAQEELKRLAEMPYRGFKHCTSAMVSPILTHDSELRAFLILGLNHRRPLDKPYRQWLGQLNTQIGNTIGKVVYLQTEVSRMLDLERAELERHKTDELKASLEQKIQELKQSELKFSTIAASIPVGLVLLNEKGSVTWANDAWYHICGLDKSKHGDLWATIIYTEDHDMMVNTVQECIDGGPAIKDLEFRCGNNNDPGMRAWDKWCRCSVDPSFDGSGNVVGFFATLVDITSIKLAEEYQRQLTIEAIETRRQMNNYIDVTSHELRNPLSAVLQSADEIQYLVEMIYQDQDIPPRAQQILEAADTIVACGDHQKKIIDDILNVSKLDAGLMVVDPLPAQPHLVLQRALKIFKPEFKSKEITSTFALSEAYKANCEESWFMVDPARLTQVFMNLITNAIKFTSQKTGIREVNILLDASMKRPDVRDNFATAPSGSNELTGREDSENTNGDVWYLHIHVQDTGIGITKEWQRTMGQRFQQAPKTHQQYGGSGLGLFIARRLTVLLGGELHFESEHRTGSTFSFFVKAPKCPPPANSTIVVPEQQQHIITTKGLYAHKLVRQRTKDGLDGKSTVDTPSLTSRAVVDYDVLVVEDNKINQTILKKQLESYGCTTTVANDGLEALTILEERRNTPFTIVLMDQEMPVMDGVTATTTIRHKESSLSPPRHLPIIGTSANARHEQINYMINAGMDDVITKPFLIKNLMLKIEQVLSRLLERHT